MSSGLKYPYPTRVSNGHTTLSRHILDMPKYWSNILIIFLLLIRIEDTLGHVGNTHGTCYRQKKLSSKFIEIHYIPP